MTDFAVTVALLKSRKKVVKAPELYQRYEITASNDSVQGEIYVPTGTTFASNDTLTVTIS